MSPTEQASATREMKPFSVLRVGTFPSETRNGVGLPAYMLAADTRYSTVYRTPAFANGEVPCSPPGDQVDLGFVPVSYRPMPRNGTSSLRTAVALARGVGALAAYTTRVLLDRRARRVDLVHVHSPMYAGVGAYAKLRGIPAVLTVHGTDFLRLRDAAPIRWALAPFDEVLCVSQRFVDELRVIFPGKRIEPVYNGVDVELFSPIHAPAEGRRRRIISVGSLRWQKDHRQLIAAFAGVSGDHPGWELTIVGEGVLRPELEQQADELDVGDRVRFVRNMSHGDLARELAASEIFAMSSVAEGLPKALLEAMASGCACVATDVGECRDTLGSSGLVVPPEDSVSLAEALASLASDAELRRELGRSAVDRAQRFTWQAYRDRHLRIYRRLLGIT